MSLFSDVEKRDYTKGYSLTSNDRVAMEQFINSRDSLKMDYVDFVKKGTDWKMKNNEKAEMIRLQNKKYYFAMMGLCAVPFSKGVNAKTIATAAGMYSMMCLLSPGFRKELGPKNLYSKAAYTVLNAYADKYPNSKLANKAESYRKKLAIHENNGRLPLTAETAAMNKVGWIEKVYEDVRSNPERADEIMDDYNRAVDLLNEMCARDGVDHEEVNRQMSGIIAVRFNHNPNYAKYFQELNNGNAQLLMQTLEGVGPDGQKVMYAEAKPRKNPYTNKMEYILDRNGNAYTGTFTPRTPSSENVYAKKAYAYCQDYADHFEGKPNSYGEVLKDVAFNMVQNSDAEMFMDDYAYVYSEAESPEDAYNELKHMSSEMSTATYARMLVNAYDKSIKNDDAITRSEAVDSMMRLYAGCYSQYQADIDKPLEEQVQWNTASQELFMDRMEEKGLSTDDLNTYMNKYAFVDESGKFGVRDADTMNDYNQEEVDQMMGMLREHCVAINNQIVDYWNNATSDTLAYDTSVKFQDIAYERRKDGYYHVDGSPAYGHAKAPNHGEGYKGNNAHMPSGYDDYDPYMEEHMMNGMGPDFA